jgi:hypothetical protein
MSLGYGFLCVIPQNYRAEQASVNNHPDDCGRSGPKIVNRLLAKRVGDHDPHALRSFSSPSASTW